MTITHTPTPWTLETVPTSCGLCHKIGPFPWKAGKTNHACIYVDYPGNGDIEKELLANAERIILAVNNHDALVEALQIALAIIHSQVAVVDSKYDNGLKQCRAALAKLEAAQ